MDKYISIKELTPSGYDFVIKALASGVENGKYPLEDGAYAAVSEYETKPMATSKFEAHRKFIDVQLILSGSEIIGVCPTDGFSDADRLGEYNPDKDVEFFAVRGDFEKLALSAGDFAILYPEDAHMPGVHETAPAQIKKIVLKIPVK